MKTAKPQESRLLMHVLTASIWAVATLVAIVFWSSLANGPTGLILLRALLVISGVIAVLLAMSLFGWWRSVHKQ